MKLVQLLSLAIRGWRGQKGERPWSSLNNCFHSRAVHLAPEEFPVFVTRLSTTSMNRAQERLMITFEDFREESSSGTTPIPRNRTYTIDRKVTHQATSRVVWVNKACNAVSTLQYIFELVVVVRSRYPRSSTNEQRTEHDFSQQSGRSQIP